MNLKKVQDSPEIDEEKSLVKQEFIAIDKTSLEKDTFPLAHQNISDETSPVIDTVLPLAHQHKLEYSSKQNDSQNIISRIRSNIKDHQKYPECDRTLKCREILSPVKSSNLRSQRISSNYVIRDQLRFAKWRENRDKHEASHRENVGKSTFSYNDESCQSNLLLDSRSEKNDWLHIKNIHERGSESKSIVGSFKGNKTRFRSISRSPKRQSHFEVQRDQSKKYMGQLRRSKSPDDIKKTFIDKVFGDKDRVIRKDTAASSLKDFVFDEGHNSGFENASSNSLLPSHSTPVSCPKSVYGFQFCVKAEKQGMFAQETFQNDLYRQSQYQGNQQYLGSYKADQPVPHVNIQEELHKS